MFNEYFEKVARKFSGFEVRPGQLEMFKNVLAAYEEEKTFLIEAGTGIGKSLAYLIPAILWAHKTGQSTVIATHTIALQEQLLQKDIPFLLEALNVQLKAVLVKGMNNYICLRKLYDNQSEVPSSILSWSKKSIEGSRSELPVIASSDLWELIGAESESCTYVKCPYYKECFFFKARKQASEAKLIVANHHVLFADLAIREETGNFDEDAVLPAYKHLIIDEAHHCESVATHYFSNIVSRKGLIHQLGRLFSDRGTGKLVTLYKKICIAYPNGHNLAEILTIILPAAKRKIVEHVNSTFGALFVFFNHHQEEDKFRLRSWHLNDLLWIEEVHPVAQMLVMEGKGFLSEIGAVRSTLRNMKDPALENLCEGLLAEIDGICGRLERLFEMLSLFVFSALEENKVRWMEGVSSDLHLISADLEVAPRLSKTLFGRLPTIVLCSATLATNGSFNFVRHQLGIKEAEESIYPSPFNFNEQAQLSVPLDLPDPSNPTFVKEASEKVWEIIEICQGGAFVLFTSHAMLKQCEHFLYERLQKKQYVLYSQGEESRSVLLNKFRSSEKGVLFGTDSFWEGVDVAGQALRCVIIVKLPFKVPSDPLFQARSEAIASKGGSAFYDYSLPHAIVKFKQGFGRLIRTKEDRGCVVCLDSRLANKGYGKKIIKSLPQCPVILEPASICMEKIKAFYESGGFF